MSVALLSVPVMVGSLAAAILIIGATLALTLRLRKIDQLLDGVLRRVDALYTESRHRAEPAPKVKEGWQSKQELGPELHKLRSMLGTIPGETARQVKALLEDWSPPTPAAPPSRSLSPAYDRYGDEPDEPTDGLTQLVAIANRIVQQSSTTLDAFRASAGAVATQVAAWPNSTDGVPLAFIVEHRGAHYAVPNVVKPARLPKEWFNRSEFGINDEIQRVVSLPRLQRRGDDYDVQQPGVFGR